LFRPEIIVDAHIHMMTHKRTRGGIRWVKRNFAFDHVFSEEVTEEELIDNLNLAGVNAFFNYFYPLQPQESQVLNAWQREFALRNPRAIPFASLHAGDDNKGEIIRKALEEDNLAGFKFHPYAQGFRIDDPAMMEVYRELQERGCPVVFHTGFAGFFGLPSVKGGLKSILKQFPGLTVVAAHLLYQDVPFKEIFSWLDEYPGLYLDATNVFAEMGSPVGREGEEITRLLQEYSAKVIFGSDFPLAYAPLEALYNQAVEYCATQEVADNIFWRSAVKMLSAGGCGRNIRGLSNLQAVVDG